MALYRVKPIGDAPVPIYPVLPIANAGAPVAELVADHYAHADVIHEQDGALLISTPTLAGFVDAKRVRPAPYFAVDLYRQEFSGKPPMDKLVGWPALAVLIMKCTDGSAYDTRWFNTYWDQVRVLAGPRYGDTFFRAAYHFLRYGKASATGDLQAKYYLRVLAKAGGWRAGDVVPIVDVEDGNEKTAAGQKQRAASAQQVIDYTTAFADTIFDEIGVRPILYGGSSIRRRKITDKMGCPKVWVARYTTELPSKTYRDMGRELDEVWGWQAGGTDPNQRVRAAGIPKAVPGVTKQVDMNVLFAKNYRDLMARV